MGKQGDLEESAESKPAKRQDAKLVLLGIAAIALVWFALGNFGSVSIDFWVRHSHAPLIVVIIISGLLGALIATVALWRRAPRG